MSKLLMNDEVDYSSEFHPTHIIGKYNQLVPVYLGTSKTVVRGLMGIYVKDCDYDKINHEKAYIFIHDPEANEEDIIDIKWDEIEDIKEDRKVGRNHIHIWK